MTPYLNPGILGALWIDEAESLSATRVLQSQELFRFPSNDKPSENEAFESELAQWTGAAAASTFSSGTAALKAGLVALGVQSGDLVLVSAYTFLASASAIIALGAVPYPLDMDEKMGVECESIIPVIARAKAVISVYVPGHASNISDVVMIAHSHGVPVLEDASQALGVKIGNTCSGLVGDIGAYSFQQGKQITCGEGGALVSRSASLVESGARFADHGAFRDQSRWPDWDNPRARLGENLRMTEMQAAILRVQLGKCADMIIAQRELRAGAITVATRFDIPFVESHCPDGDSGSALIFCMPSAEQAVSAIKAAQTHRILLKYIWKQPYCDLGAYRRFADPDAMYDAPRARDMSARLLSLPTPPLRDAGVRQAFLESLGVYFAESGKLWS